MKQLKTVFVNSKGQTIGEDRHRAKLTDADIDMIFALREAGLSMQKIAGKFDDIEGGISTSHICRVLNGDRRAQSPAGQRRRLVNVAAKEACRIK